MVALPTETVYGLAASALDEEAVGRLLATKGRAEIKPLTLAIKSADEARDYAPDMCPLGRRLARRCWPGPVTLVVDDSHPESLVRQLPPQVQQAVSPQQSIGLRVPGHPVMLDVLRMLAGPLGPDQRQPLGHARGRQRQARSSTCSATTSTWWSTTGRAASASRRRWSASAAADAKCCARESCPSGPCSGCPA